MGRITAYFSFSRSLLRFAIGGLLIGTVLTALLILWTVTVVDHETELIVAHGDAIATGDAALIEANSTDSLVDDVQAHASEAVIAVVVSFAVFYGGAMLIFSFEENRRRRLEQQIAAVQRHDHLALMAADTAHDFNNLLTTVTGNASLTRAGIPVDSAVQEYLGDIEFAVERASEPTR